MTINGVEVSFNIAEEVSNKRVMKALKSVSKDSEASEGKEGAEQIRIMCTSVKNAFDYVFGAGTGEKICGKENDLNACANAFADLLEEKNRQDEILKQTRMRLMAAIDGKGNDELSD